MKKRIVKLVAFAMAAALSLTGCGSSGEKAASEAATKGTAQSAAAQDTAQTAAWPGKSTITIVVPAKAGGINDTIARLMQNWLQTNKGATAVVTNYDTKAVGYEALHGAKNDGNTIMLQHSTLFAEAAGGTVTYDPTEELSICGEINTLGVAAYIAPVDAPYNTFSELVEYAKENPGKVAAAYSARGMSHFQWGAIEQATGIDFNLVDASSESEKLTNVAGGFIGLAGVTYGSAKEYAAAGKVKILSLAGDPELAKELGVESMEDLGFTTMAVNYMYVWAPGGVDQATLEAMNAVLCEMTEDPAFQEQMATAGYPAMTADLATATANAKAEMTSAKELAAVLGLN